MGQSIEGYGLGGLKEKSWTCADHYLEQGRRQAPASWPVQKRIYRKDIMTPWRFLSVRIRAFDWCVLKTADSWPKNVDDRNEIDAHIIVSLLRESVDLKQLHFKNKFKININMLPYQLLSQLLGVLKMMHLSTHTPMLNEYQYLNIAKKSVLV